MKNSIWVGKNEHDDSYMCTQKIMLDNSSGCLVYAGNGGEFDSKATDVIKYTADIYNLNLRAGEVVEIIIDTERQSYEIKREREIGWYLTRESEDVAVFVRFWDGETWCACPKSKGWIRYSDSSIVVVSDKLPYNEYLRSLEI